PRIYLLSLHDALPILVPNTWVPVFYSVAMGISGLGSLIFGHLFDRIGFWILIPLTVISAASAPLVFLGGFWLALLGAAIWGLGIDRKSTRLNSSHEWM